MIDPLTLIEASELKELLRYDQKMTKNWFPPKKNIENPELPRMDKTMKTFDRP